MGFVLVVRNLCCWRRWALWVYVVFFEHMNGLGFLFEWLWACLVTKFKQQFSHFKHTYRHFNTFFHPHVFQKISKTSNNNFQTHLPNEPYFTGFSYFFFMGLQMKFLVKRASVYELQCKEGIPNVLGCNFQALFSILKKIENFCFFVFNLDADMVLF